MNAGSFQLSALLLCEKYEKNKQCAFQNERVMHGNSTQCNENRLEMSAFANHVSDETQNTLTVRSNAS